MLITLIVCRGLLCICLKKNLNLCCDGIMSSFNFVLTGEFIKNIMHKTILIRYTIWNVLERLMYTYLDVRKIKRAREST